MLLANAHWLPVMQVVLGAADKETKVVINVPPALKWDLSTHKLFPNEFKATTRALLIAHHTLRHGSSVTPQASESLSTSASGCSLLVESLDVSKVGCAVEWLHLL